jgi:hypothetical protein
MGDQSVAKTLPTHRTAQTQNKCIETYMTQVGFKLMTPVFEQVKTVHALDWTATVISLPTVSSNMKPKAYRSLHLPETL